LRLGLIDVGDAGAWLTDPCWIVMGYDGGFAQYLEQLYFSPGTPKNAEFEVLVAQLAVRGIFGIAAFYRIKDTVDNRDALRVAITEFHEKRLLSLAELDNVVESLRRDIKENILPRLR
jgi:hypothetical protein